jgi:hypothetical protein
LSSRTTFSINTFDFPLLRTLPRLQRALPLPSSILA